MDPLNLLKTFLKFEGNVQPNIKSLKVGQIIAGKIIRFFPNQTAEIQIGSQRLIAKLEVSLLANQQYWFQVQPGDGKIRLKMIKRNNDDRVSFDQQPPLVYKENLEESHGALEQFVTQIPLQTENRTSEITIQWNGRKKKDGKIDPNYCRVLLYLDLENIGDTFVDLYIQNRIMSISISNEREDLKIIASPLIDFLKEKLSKMDYKLSAVSFEYPTKMKKGVFSSFESTSYEGVDIRI